MKKLSFLLMALVMVVMTSCSSGIDTKKCNELLNKDYQTLSTSDMEYLADQYDILVTEISQASDPAAWFEANSDKEELFTNFAGFAVYCQSVDVPSSVQKKMESVMKKMKSVM
ncbi:MAG: hypothetical protein K2H17_08320 [Duncaniella sp.]|uniref:hypothetical protein n=1 Tax=Duncaniella sp. TaxID=2518496 RepID=UPI0023C43A03|nr:hypothetical protein [Duncaniella sp.]MDE5989389.1 hypothetical protein [Duncaniella sp.]